MHSKLTGSDALVPIVLTEGCHNELLPEFPHRLVERNSGLVHLTDEHFQLILQGMFPRSAVSPAIRSWAENTMQIGKAVTLVML